MIEVPRACIRAGDDRRDRGVLLLRHERPHPDDARRLARRRRGQVPHAVRRRRRDGAQPVRGARQLGVGELMRIAVEQGRAAKPDLKIGICGEHGGEPRSVAFCHDLGLDYVSCSPFRVPFARLAAAQAAIAEAGSATYVRRGRADGARAELRRQAEHLVGLGYPSIDLGRWSERPPRSSRAARRAACRSSSSSRRPPERRHELIARAELGGKPGFTTMEPDDLARFEPIDGRRAAGGRVPARGRRHGRRDAERHARRRAGAIVGARAARRSRSTRASRSSTQLPGAAPRAQLLLAARLPLRRPPRHRDLGERAPPAARLVLGGQPAHVARLGVVRRAGRRGRGDVECAVIVGAMILERAAGWSWRLRVCVRCQALGGARASRNTTRSTSARCLIALTIAPTMTSQTGMLRRRVLRVPAAPRAHRVRIVARRPTTRSRSGLGRRQAQ